MAMVSSARTPRATARAVIDGSALVIRSWMSPGAIRELIVLAVATRTSASRAAATAWQVSRMITERGFTRQARRRARRTSCGRRRAMDHVVTEFRWKTATVGDWNLSSSPGFSPGLSVSVSADNKSAPCVELWRIA